MELEDSMAITSEPLTSSTLSEKFERLVTLGLSPMAIRSFQRDIEQYEKHHLALNALMQAASEMSRVAGALDLQNLIDFVLDTAIGLIGAERGLLVLNDDSEKGFAIMSARQLSKEQDSQDIALSQSLLKEVIKNRKPIVTTNAQSDPRFAEQKSVMVHSIRSVLAVPLASSNKVTGALYLDTQISTQVFTETDLAIILAFANMTSSALESVKFLESRHEFFLGSVQSLVNAIEAKDPYTAGHSSRVGLYAQAIVRALGHSEDEAEQALIAGYLHDVGKIGINDAYVTKPGPLTDKEWQDFKQHTIIGEQILSNTKALKPILPAVRWHHEKLDGTGYPDGLKANEIPLLARIICVADSFDAMTSDRPYRLSPGMDYALKELDKFKGSQYDATIVDALKQAFDEGITAYFGKG